MHEIEHGCDLLGVPSLTHEDAAPETYEDSVFPERGYIHRYTHFVQGESSDTLILLEVVPADLYAPWLDSVAT
jgi:hypothetical protein